MGSSPLMSLGVKAMTANYAALQTTGHNIANANVAGYSRQRTELATSQGQFTGAGFFGRGVDVVSVTRSYDGYLTREATNGRAMAAMDSARLTQLQRLETVFQSGELGLGNATSDLMNAMVDLSSQPADAASRRVVLARAGDLAARFSEAGAALDTVQAGVTADLRAAVADINSLAKSIAQANQRVAELQGLGQPANDVLDERDRLISNLAEQVHVTRMDTQDGSVSVFVGGGQRLVLGSQASALSVLQDPADPTRAAVGLREGGVQRTLEPASLGGGAITGLLRFQNEDLVQAQTQVGQLAAALGGAVNLQQMRGINMQQPFGAVPSAALFGMGAPRALASSTNVRDASGQPLATVSITITDPSALQASEYDLREDAANPGTMLLTRLFDGQTTTVAGGSVVDGMQIDFGSVPPQTGDRFLLQPVSRAANGMTRLLDDPRDIAAASALVANAAAANRGTANVTSLQVTAAPLPVPGATARFTFSDDAGNYNWELLDNANNVLASGADTWKAGQPMPPAGTDINGFTIKLSGVPRSGDVISVAPTPANAMASNNGNALALMALRDTAIVGGKTPTDSWALALADIGVRVQTGTTASEISDAVARQNELARSGQSGVNLDEEAARLIQFQQSYQAAAKVLQVAQALFDTLLSAAAGR
jgi:flagellar hook-associated protein 1 FlgK